MLASGSPRRRELLARLGVLPEVRPADVDETPHEGEAAGDLVLRLARAKAAAVAGDDDIVLAADTVVVVDGQALGKPRDAEEAATMLHRLSGRVHEVQTGVAVRVGAREATCLVTTRVRFRDLTDAEVAWYVGTGEPLDKAGGYGLQGAGAVLVEGIDGSDTNVIGLPLAESIALLREAGLELLTASASEPR